MSHSSWRRQPRPRYILHPQQPTDRYTLCAKTGRNDATRERTRLMLSVLQESFWERLSGVVGLKRPTYEVIQRDPEATSQSWWIVVLLGLANGIALIATPIVTEFPGMTDEMAGDVAALAAAFTFDTTERQIMALAVAILLTILSWHLTSWLLQVIGNRVAGSAGRKVTTAEMRRLVGWGYS